MNDILPNDFKPRQQDIDAVKETHPHVDLDCETRKFLEYFADQSGPIKNAYVRWRGWIRRAKGYTPDTADLQSARTAKRRAQITRAIATIEDRRNTV